MDKQPAMVLPTLVDRSHGRRLVVAATEEHTELLLPCWPSFRAVNMAPKLPCSPSSGLSNKTAISTRLSRKTDRQRQ